MDALQTFTPISLADLSTVALLDRIDTKYVLASEQFSDLLPLLRPAYRVLAIDGRRQSFYRTLYFDTPDFALYRSHQDGRRVRYKVRSRHYVDTPLTFFEVKQKTGRNHTHKARIATPALVTELTEPVAAFLHDCIPVAPKVLEPKLWVDYRRITLAGRQAQERVTIDLDLRYSFDGRELALPGLAIVELKSEGRPRTSPLAHLMRERLIRTSGFSKYCVGASLLYPELKHNRFTRILRKLERLQVEPCEAPIHSSISSREVPASMGNHRMQHMAAGEFRMVTCQERGN